MTTYRTHTCGELAEKDVGTQVKLSGWVHRKRDHGGVLFLDIRDHYGITQCTISNLSKIFNDIANISLESVVTLEGKVIKRPDNHVNPNMATGKIELSISDMKLISKAAPLPISVNSNDEYPENTRLRHRFLDLRRQKLHENIMLRTEVIAYLRQSMTEQGFQEFQTPILTASSPEGARDFLVPSRTHPGKFYALPQAPQLFKQMLMVSGFDKYFQIAPCFRDEDGRADRSPTEFYQLDFEMSFATQEDIFKTIEPVLHGVFNKFGKNRSVTNFPFPQISYDTAMLKYGSDKPDLRNPIEIADVTHCFKDSEFKVFSNAINNGSVVRVIPAPGAVTQSRRFFNELEAWARAQGASGLGYISMGDDGIKGNLSKYITPENLLAMQKTTGTKQGDVLFFVCDTPLSVAKMAGKIRTKLGQDLDLIDKDRFELCWIVDFPMYEINEETGQYDFSHNPFSMPQGGLETLNTQDPLNIKAFQFDIVCNGYELSSGAIRNHDPEIMYRAFEITGYKKEDVDQRFGSLIRAFQFGAPPHGGSAPGIDRIVMLLADEPNLREIVAFPTMQNGYDPLMDAPSPVNVSRLKEVYIKLGI